MPKLAANLSMMFNEVPFMDRFDAAAQAGFKGVEFLFPYEFDLNQIADKLKANNLELVLHNLPAGNWGGGERGLHHQHPGGDDSRRVGNPDLHDHPGDGDGRVQEGRRDHHRQGLPRTSGDQAVDRRADAVRC